MSRAQKAQVGMVITGTTLKESAEAIQLAKQYGQYCTVGCHPTRCLEAETPGYFEELSALMDEQVVVAVGECGLDYDRLQFCPKEVQIKYFKEHFKLSKKHQLPMFFHNRNTGMDFYTIVAEHRADFPQGVVHSFDGTWEEACKAIELNLFIGINGCSLKTKENLDVVKQIPLDRLVIETDAPWCGIKPSHASYALLESKQLPLTKKKEKFEQGVMVKDRNEPCRLIEVATVISRLKSVDLGTIKEQCLKNTRLLFSKIRHF